MIACDQSLKMNKHVREKTKYGHRNMILQLIYYIKFTSLVIKYKKKSCFLLRKLNSSIKNLECLKLFVFSLSKITVELF